MTVLSGGLFLIEVETAPNVWTECADLTRVTKANNANVSRTRVFRKTYRARGTSDRAITLAGLLNYTDAGQAALLAAERTNTPIRVRWSETGSTTSMTMQTVRVATVTHEGTPDPGELQTITYELRGVGDPTAISIAPTTPQGLLARYNELGAGNQGGQMLVIYAYGVQQTIVPSGDASLPSPGTASPTGFFCTKWDDAVNPGAGKHWRPSAGGTYAGNGAPCSASGIIQGVGLELPDSTGLTGGALFHADANLMSDASIPSSGNMKRIGGDRTAGWTFGAWAKEHTGDSLIALGEAGDLNFIESPLGDDFGNICGFRNSATLWTGGASTPAGSPPVHVAMTLKRIAEPSAAGTWENWRTTHYMRDAQFHFPSAANSTAAGRRLRLGGPYGATDANANRSVFGCYIVAGHSNKAQTALVCDYGDVQYLTFNDTRRLGYLLGDSEFVAQVDLNTWQIPVQDGAEGADPILNFGFMPCALTGSRPNMMMHLFLYFLQGCDFSKRPDSGVAFICSEWINSTPANDSQADSIAQNYWFADALHALNPAKCRVAMHNMTYAANDAPTNFQQTVNDPSINNDLQAHAIADGHADFLINYLLNTISWNADSEIYSDGNYGRNTKLWDGIHPFHLLQTAWRARARVGFMGALGDDVSAVGVEVLSSLPVVNLTAGAPTATPVWTTKNNAGGTIAGRTYSFEMYTGGSGSDTVDHTKATVHPTSGLITRVAAGISVCRCVSNKGEIGLCIVKCT